MFEKYAEYSVEDFVNDDKFIEWVKFSDAQTNAFWSDFIIVFPGQQETVYQAYQIVMQLSEASRPSTRYNDSDEIWSGVESAISRDEQQVKPLFQGTWFPWMAAASVTLLIGLFWWNNTQVMKPDAASVYTALVEEAKIPLEEVINTSGKPLGVALPDSSMVFLQANSRLSYAKDFKGKERQVFLSGAAFFNVVKNPEKPFIVYANELVTKVLGTSFSVNAFEKAGNVIVSVRTGKVSVFEKKYMNNQDPAKKGVILIPNQQVAFSRKKETLSRTLVAQPRIIVSQEELLQFNFTNAPVAGIFEAMGKAYGVDILFDEELLSGCRLTTSLSDETLFERLDIVCEAIEASYKVVNAQIIITGKKCN